MNRFLLVVLTILVALPLSSAKVGPAPQMPADGSPAIEEGGMSVAVMNATYANASRVNFSDRLQGGTNAPLWLVCDSTQPGITLGSICRAITFRVTGEYDRTWMTWLNASNRNMASVGWHYKNSADDVIHNQWEIKTSGDPDGPNAGDMRTRFSIDSDVDLSTASFGYTDMVEVHRTYAENEAATLRFRTDVDASGTSSTRLFDLAAWVDSSGNTIAAIDPYTMDSADASTLRLFRSTNAGAAKVSVFAGDGSTTETFTINARTGAIEKAGAATFTGAHAINGTVTLGGTGSTTTLQSFVSGSGGTIYGIDPLNGDSTKTSEVRVCRSTNAASCIITFYKGDGTGTATFQINARTGDMSQVNDITLGGEIDWASSALGTCNSTSTNRGREVWVEGGAGVADEKYICRKDASDVYAWQKATWT